MRPAPLLTAALLLLAGSCSSAPPPPAPAPAPAGLPPDPGPAGDLLAPSRDGDRLFEGVAVLSPRLEGNAAAFGLRNGSPSDLPDLILAVVFAVPGADGEAVPAIVTLEAPLARGETREFRAALAGAGPPASFRVLAGPPELLAAAAEGLPGTTFLGGLLECVSLEADLVAESPTVTVGLRDRAGAALPPLEGQLLLARAGSLVWSGPWILLPRGDPERDGLRTVHWNLPRERSLAGASLFLRVRARR